MNNDVPMFPADEPEVDCQQPDDDYDPSYRRERFGNNRKKTKGLDVKRRRKLAQASKRKNRK